MIAVRHAPPSENLPVSADAHTWKPLHFLNLYRLTLSGLLLVLAVTNPELSALGKTAPRLFELVSAAYLVFSIAASFAIRWRLFGFSTQVYAQVFVDILAVTLLMHGSGGVASGIGMLLIVAIAAGSLLMAGRMATLFAAIAALAVLSEQIYSHLTGAVASASSYMQTGLLGAAFFATALLARVLANRVMASEALAAQRASDLAHLARLNETIIQRMQSGVLVIDAQGQVRLMNESARSLLGTPIVGAGQELQSFAPALAEQLHAWRTAPLDEPRVFRNPMASADVLPRFTQLDPKGTTLIFLEDAAAIAQQVQQAKLASLGRLTASIAHEVRNPLGAISHAAQLLAESPSLSEDDQRLTEIIREQSRRVNTIVENVLQLSRRQRSRPETFALGPWLEDFVAEFALAENIRPEQVTIDVQRSADVLVRIDPNHLHQILWNLCQNALRHGASENGPAHLVLRGGHDHNRRSPYLEVIDSGPGISPEIAQQIFEPFFTAQPHGTGLGLYIARELCEHNQARLNYRPNPTGGSCFRISFANPEQRVLQA